MGAGHHQPDPGGEPRRHRSPGKAGAQERQEQAAMSPSPEGANSHKRPPSAGRGDWGREKLRKSSHLSTSRGTKWKFHPLQENLWSQE